MKKYRGYGKRNQKFYLASALLSVLLCLGCQYTVWSIGQIVHEEHLSGVDYSIRVYETMLPEWIAEQKEALKQNPEDFMTRRMLEIDLEEYEDMKKHINNIRSGREWLAWQVVPSNVDNLYYRHYIYDMWVPQGVYQLQGDKWADNISQEMCIYMYKYTFYFLLALQIILLGIQGAIHGRTTQEFLVQMPVSRKKRFIHDYTAGLFYTVGAWILALVVSGIFYRLQGVRLREIWGATAYALFYVSLFYTAVFVIKDFFALPVWGVIAGTIMISFGMSFFNEDIAKTIVINHLRGKDWLYCIPVVLLIWGLLLLLGLYRAGTIRFPRNHIIETRFFGICVSLFIGRLSAACIDKRDRSLHFDAIEGVYGLLDWDIEKYIVFAGVCLVIFLLIVWNNSKSVSKHFNRIS